MASFDWVGLAASMAETERLAQAGIARVPPPDMLADFVRLQRGFLGWKQECLASFASVSLSTVERIERAESVSAESLDRVAIALGQKPGAFTEPRVPLTFDQLEKAIEESTAQFSDRTTVPVRPLRTQPQVAELARAELCFIDGSRLGEVYHDDIASLREMLDFASFVLATDEPDSIVRIDRREPVKRRQLYTMVLDAVREIERRGYAVALAGTYQVETGAAIMPTANVALIGFFSKLTDPGAVKRKILLAPAKVDLRAAWENFCREDDAGQQSPQPR